MVGYYSMLHRKPLGKYHVQVCTNISCLLVGGEELYEHAATSSGSDKEVTPDGLFAGRSGVHGRVHLGPGHSGQLRFPSSCDAGELDQLIDGCEKAAKSDTER